MVKKVQTCNLLARGVSRAVVGMFFAGLVTAQGGTEFSTNTVSDLAIYVASNAHWKVPAAGIDMSWGWNETHPVPGDFNGDGMSDMAVYHRKTGAWFIKTKAGATLAWNMVWGHKNAHAVGFGDYNNDGSDDMAVYDPFASTWFIKTLAGYVLAWNRPWGASHFQPVPGDYDGDGTTDLGMYDRNAGKWYILSLDKGVLAWAIPWGFSTARPVPGDFDGDGKHDLAVYQKQAGAWFIRTVSGTVLAWNRKWGFASGRSVPGDYDGDGRDDLAVYAPNGAWYVLSIASNQVLRYGTQLGGDRAVPIGMYGHGGEGHIIMAHGDSITYGRGSSSNGPPTSYPDFLDQRFEPEFGGISYVINSGVPGESTRRGKDRLLVNLDQRKPTLTLIMEGTNDMFFQFTDSTILNNLTFMANSAKARGSSVVMATLPPIVSRLWENRDLQHARVFGINPSIRTLAGSLGWPYAETYNSIASKDNWRNVYFKSSETLHPNDEGYKIICDEFMKSIRAGINAGTFVF